MPATKRTAPFSANELGNETTTPSAPPVNNVEQRYVE